MFLDEIDVGGKGESSKLSSVGLTRISRAVHPHPDWLALVQSAWANDVGEQLASTSLASMREQIKCTI